MMIVERLEENKAVIEIQGRLKVVDRSLLHKDVREGDVLTLKGDIYVTDESQTKERKERLEERFKALWKK